jgi:hypothetical protein
MLPEATAAQAEIPLDSPPEHSMEAALKQLDDRLAATGRALAAVQKQLKQAADAARHGKLRDLPRTLDGLVESSRTLSQTAVNARRDWVFDAEPYMEDGRYLAELLDQVQAARLEGARDVDGQLYSFPVIVKVHASDLSLKVGKKLNRNLRPSVVVSLLKKLRAQPAKDNVRQLLHAFEAAYLRLTNDRDGYAISLRKVHSLLVLRPGQSREYTELDFMLDVYKLDRAGVKVTQSGRELSLPASTGTRGGGGLRFVTETGEERLYNSIRFDSR